MFSNLTRTARDNQWIELKRVPAHMQFAKQGLTLIDSIVCIVANKVDEMMALCDALKIRLKTNSNHLGPAC